MDVKIHLHCDQHDRQQHDEPFQFKSASVSHPQEMSTHTIPSLPPRSAPPAFAQQNQPVFLGPSSSQLPLNVNAHQPEGVVYSGISHRHEGYFY